MKPGIFLLIGLVILDFGLFASLWYWLTPSIPTTNLSIPLFAILFTTIGVVFMAALGISPTKSSRRSVEHPNHRRAR